MKNINKKERKKERKEETFSQKPLLSLVNLLFCKKMVPSYDNINTSAAYEKIDNSINKLITDNIIY